MKYGTCMNDIDLKFSEPLIIMQYRILALYLVKTSKMQRAINLCE